MTSDRDSLLRQSGPVTYKLYIPERGTRRPIISTLPCPERIQIAWHKDATGVYELLDADGHGRYGAVPQERCWEVRTYQRAMHDCILSEAFYEEVRDA